MRGRRMWGAILILLAAALGGCEKKSEPAAPAKTVTLRIVHGPELRAFLSSMREQFALTHPTLNDGSRLLVELIPEMPVPAAKSIASGEIKSEAWIAPSTSLVNFANATVHGLGAKQIECTPLFKTPIVIATRPENREFFGTATDRFSWRDLFEGSLTRSEKTPDANYVVYSHASPEASVTGLDSLLQLTYLASRRESPLSVESLESEGAFRKLERFENLVSNYSLSESYLLERAARATTKRIRFAITTEQQVRMYNVHRQNGAPELIALFPEEGSMIQDYSLCLSEADWVTPAHRAALRLFAESLITPNAQETAKSRGFRPAAAPAAETAPADAASAPAPAQSTPSAGPEFKEFSPVSGEVISHLLSLWPDLKRPAAAAIVFDNSGSMEGQPLRACKEYLRNLLARMPERDLKALVSFSTTPKVEARFTHDAGAIIQSLDRLTALGGSAVYDGIRTGIELMTSPDLVGYRKSILVITDGNDKNSESSLQGLLDYINSKLAQYDINLMIIGISHDEADFSDLEKTVQVANGLFREGPPAKFPAIFQDIQKNL